MITPRYGPTRSEITVGDQEPITVRHRGWFGPHYEISTPKGEMSAVVGDFSRESYAITGLGAMTAEVSRDYQRQGNLTIDISDPEDSIPFLAVVLAIETLRDDRRQNLESLPRPRTILRLLNLDFG